MFAPRSPQSYRISQATVLRLAGWVGLAGTLVAGAFRFGQAVASLESQITHQEHELARIGARQDTVVHLLRAHVCKAAECP